MIMVQIFLASGLIWSTGLSHLSFLLLQRLGPLGVRIHLPHVRYGEEASSPVPVQCVCKMFK